MDYSIEVLFSCFLEVGQAREYIETLKTSSGNQEFSTNFPRKYLRPTTNNNIFHSEGKEKSFMKRPRGDLNP